MEILRGGVLRHWLTLALVLVFAAVLVRTAWMSDDAYITLRTVDNVVHGYGLTWNAGERVQAYTHPLWMLVLTAAYFVTREAYYTPLAIALAVSIATFVLVTAGVAGLRQAALAAGIALIVSKAFTDFSTGGLENPLTNLLLVLFFLALWRLQRDVRGVFLLSLIAALLAVTRLDALLLVAPAYVWALWQSRGVIRCQPWRAVGAISLGFAPLILWELFSLLYYGFLTPNTYFAKLNAGVAQAALWRQGLSYLIRSTQIDPVSTLVILGGSLTALLVALRSRQAKWPILLAWAAGMWLYLVYVVSIGGDFMSGRFLAAPVLMAVLIVAAALSMGSRALAWGFIAVVALVGLLAPGSPVARDQIECSYLARGWEGVVDERACYYEGTGLLRQPLLTRQADATAPVHQNMAKGAGVREDATPVHILGATGMVSFAAGPTRYMLDLNALSDPLLARLPVPSNKPWRIGHFERLVPAGYVESLLSGENKLCNPGMAAFYEKLSAITRGRLLAGARLEAIWKMNTGQYNQLLAGYGNPDGLAVQLCNATTRTNLQFAGGPSLVGYSVGTFQPKAGSRLPVTLYWQRTAADADEQGANLASFVHIRTSAAGQAANARNESGRWAEVEHQEPGGRLTTEYWDGQVYVDQFMIDIPPDIPPGAYSLEVGWLDPPSGEQLEPKPESVKPPYGIAARSILLPPLTIR